MILSKLHVTIIDFLRLVRAFKNYYLHFLLFQIEFFFWDKRKRYKSVNSWRYLYFCFKVECKKCEICVSFIYDLSDDYEIRMFVQSILAMVNKLSSIMTTVQKHRRMTLPHDNNSPIYNIGFKRDKTQKTSAENVTFEHIFNRANILIILMM